MSLLTAELDQCAADLVSASVKLDILAAFVRMEGNQLRVIAPADYWPQLAKLFYRAADEMVARIPSDAKY